MLEVKIGDIYKEKDNDIEIPVLEAANYNEADIEKSEKLKDIELRINEGSTPKEYIFTECSQMRSFKDFAKGLIVKYARQPGMNYIMEEFSAEGSLDITAFTKALDYLLEARIKRDDFSDFTDRSLIDDKDKFCIVYGKTITDFCRKEEALDAISAEKDTRQTFVSFMNDILGEYGGLKNRHDKTAIEGGEEIEKRRVAMFRIAQLLGMKEVVEPAYLVRLRLKMAGDYAKKLAEFDGTMDREVKGVIRGKIRGGKTVAEIGRDTATSGISLAKHVDPVVYRQAADLMLLDYVCGNLDRSDSGISCQFREVDGSLHMTGIAGINNYTCMGNIEAGAKGHGINCESIKFISATRARALQTLDIKRMLLDLNSLYFSDAEINHLVSRVKMITQSLRQGRIKVVEDNAFNKNMDIAYAGRIHRRMMVKGTNIDALESKVKTDILEKNLKHKRHLEMRRKKQAMEKKTNEKLNEEKKPPELSDMLKRGD